MSLKTSPYTPTKVAEEPIAQVFNIAEVVTFIYPDGATRELKVYEGMLLAAVYIRRNASVAMYQMDGAQRTLVFEFDAGQLRATPVLYDATQKLLSAINAEVEEAVQQAVAAARAQDGQDGRYEQPYVAPSTSGDGYAEPAVDSALQQEESEPRAGTRFRRARR